MRAAHRVEALNLYKGLSLPTFPYDYDGRPFKGWPNPGMHQGFDELTPVVRTFGVLLTSGIVVVDVDADRGGDLSALEARFGPLPPTLTVVTPSGDGRNLHLYFRVAEPLRGSSALKVAFPGIDFLGEGQNVKGATSVRTAGDGRREVAQSYNLQHPVLDPAPLPVELERAWRATASEPPPPPVPQSGKLDPRETRFVRESIKYSLALIGQAGPGNRHDVLFRQASCIYQNAALLRKDPSSYDDQIRGAYTSSGGSDIADLEKQVRYTKEWAAGHPKSRPAFSVRHKKVAAPIAEWADAAMDSCTKNQKQKRQLITTLALSVNAEYRVTTSGEILADLAGIPQQKVSQFLIELSDSGFLDRTGGQFTLSSRWIPHFTLSDRIYYSK